MPRTFIFIGRSGSGKGTQADLLKHRLTALDPARRILYIETGERFRTFIRGQSFSAGLARLIAEAGGLQPDFLACYMWTDMLVEGLEPEMHLVFDGAPRALEEAKVLHSALTFYSRTPTTVIHIDVSRRWSEDRMLARGRADDMSLLKIDKRLDWYDDQVVPVLNYFKNDSLFEVVEVNGEQAIEKVHADICARVQL